MDFKGGFSEFFQILCKKCNVLALQDGGLLVRSKIKYPSEWKHFGERGFFFPYFDTKF